VVEFRLLTGDNESGAVARLRNVTADATAEVKLRDSEAWLLGQNEVFRAAIKDAPLDETLGLLGRTAIAQMPGARYAVAGARSASQQFGAASSQVVWIRDAKNLDFEYASPAI
jgi:hypothetical protein